MLVVAPRPPWPVAVNVGGVMSTQATTVRREPDLLGQTVVVIGGSAGIGLETARRARAEGADVILTGRDPERLARAAAEVGAGQHRRLRRHRRGRARTVLRRPARPSTTCWSPPAGPTTAARRHRPRRGAPRRRRAPVAAARRRPARRRPGAARRHAAVHGRHRRPPPRGRAGAIVGRTAALPALTANLALELAPIRVNLIAAGFVDTPLSAALLGDDLERAPRPAPRHAADPPGGRAGRRRRARRAHHDQHRAHRRDLRHRRRPAVRLMTTAVGSGRPALPAAAVALARSRRPAAAPQRPAAPAPCRARASPEFLQPSSGDHQNAAPINGPQTEPIPPTTIIDSRNSSRVNEKMVGPTTLEMRGIDGAGEPGEKAPTGRKPTIGF